MSAAQMTVWSYRKSTGKKARVLREVAQAADSCGSSKSHLPRKLPAARGQARGFLTDYMSLVPAGDRRRKRVALQKEA